MLECGCDPWIEGGHSYGARYFMEWCPLHTRAGALRAALLATKNYDASDGVCWCGGPVGPGCYHFGHTDLCRSARAALALVTGGEDG